MEYYHLPMKFNIAFIGYNKQLSHKGLQQFIDNNIEQIKNIQKSSYDFKVYLKDDTVITAISFDTNARGYKFDQYILFDDNRWLIESEKASEIQLLIARTSLYNVPEEFHILKYEDIR